MSKIPGKIIRDFKWYYRNSYITQRDGNACVRIGDNEFIITPSGVQKQDMKENSFLLVDKEGNSLRQSIFKPSIELHGHLAAMKSKIKKIIYTSTMACIGTTPGEMLSDETNEYNIWLPVNDYMRSKGFAEAVVKRFIESGLPVVTVNPTWTVGPGDINPTPVGQVIIDVIQKRYPSLSPAGINIVDVDDVGIGHVLAQEYGKIGERYILGGENIRYENFLEKISRLSGSNCPPKREEVESSFPKEFLWYDSNKAITQLKWKPRSIDETIIRSIDWFKQRGINV